MVQPIQVSQSDENQRKFALESQIRECYGRVVYTHVVHEKCADICLKRLTTIKNWQIILSAITTGTLLISIFGEGKIGTILGAVFSTILLALNTYTQDYDLGELAQKHSETANKLWQIRESYLSLLTDIAVNSLTLDQIQTKRDALQNTVAAIYQNAPRTNQQAYKKAQKALQIEEQMTFSEQEIDSFLPTTLKRNN
ncbi:SLATT domain-containing protein [Iningainema tapete]|uniref:SLATT domain-containing protein n=1 Tax=Iningainema tapete BLCC-T55 TaxID=2748662 RepID=A0A8J6XPC3_9CYAN|nr:SLATT domain-containing protein [Iningainema tapete]MBD2776801.1 SLATT domain-containing protein [Iningainema tapete BLCC-T55]